MQKSILGKKASEAVIYARRLEFIHAGYFMLNWARRQMFITTTERMLKKIHRTKSQTNTSAGRAFQRLQVTNNMQPLLQLFLCHVYLIVNHMTSSGSKQSKWLTTQKERGMHLIYNKIRDCNLLCLKQF